MVCGSVCFGKDDKETEDTTGASRWIFQCLLYSLLFFLPLSFSSHHRMCVSDVLCQRVCTESPERSTRAENATGGKKPLQTRSHRQTCIMHAHTNIARQNKQNKKNKKNKETALTNATIQASLHIYFHNNVHSLHHVHTHGHTQQ